MHPARAPPLPPATHTKRNHCFSLVGHGSADVWRQSQPHSGVSYTRICGTNLAPSLPELKEITGFHSSTMAPLTLAPEPAEFGRFLSTDMRSPPCFQPCLIYRKSVVFNRRSLLRGRWRPRQPHSEGFYTRIMWSPSCSIHIQMVGIRCFPLIRRPRVRLAREPATIGSPSHTDLWSPPCSKPTRMSGKH